MLGRGATDLKYAAVNSPAGFYELGKAVGKDIAHEASLPALRPGYNPSDSGKNIIPIGRALVKQTKTDLRHPLRHPGDTLLDVAGFASLGAGTAARGAAVSKAVRSSEAGRAGRVVRAAASKPAPQARVLKYTNSEGKTFSVTAGSYSPSASARSVQKAMDKVRESYPDARIGILNQSQRVGRANASNLRVEHDLARVPAAQLAKLTKRLGNVKWTAVRVAAEGVSVDERIAFHQALLKDLSGSAARETRQHIALLHQSRKYLDESSGSPRVVPELKSAYEATKSLAKGREHILATAGVLSPESASGRINAPGQIIREATGSDAEVSGDFRVSYRNRPLRGVTTQKGMGSGRVVGMSRLPGTINHGFTGAILRHGAGMKDVGKLATSDYLDAVRWWNSEQTRDAFRKFAQASPEGLKNPVAIRLQHGIQIRPEIQRLLSRESGGKLTKAEAYEIRRELKHQFEDVFPERVSLEPQPGIGFVERSLLGGADRPSPLVGVAPGSTASRVLGFTDAVNNASRLAILYLKPAYAIPNALGNVALTIIKQGFAAPVNLAKAVRLNHRLGPETTAAIDTLMGEGIVSALASDTGLLHGATTKAASVWSKGVDLPFRRSSFLHESDRRGFRTPRQLADLVSRPELREKLYEVTREANLSLIDYGNLGPWERTIISRVIFFFPWVRGSTVYAGRFLRDTPVKAAVTANLGQLGAETEQRNLGDVPSWFEGLIRTGGTDARPRVVNPSSATIFGSPVDIAQTAAGLFGVGPGGAPSGSLTPALGALYTLLTGNTGLGYPVRGESNARAAAESLYKGLPAVQLGQRLAGNQTSKTTSYSKQDALMKFIFGLSPFTADRARLNSQAEK